MMSPRVATAQTTPDIEYLFPAGAQRGTVVDVQLGSDFLPGAGQLTLTGPGLTLKNAIASDRFVFALAADATVGPGEVRLSVTQGSSPPFPFLIGTLPEIVRTDRRPLELKLPVTVNGRLNSSGAVDEYVLDLSAGQQIVCAAAARAFRSPLDATLRLLDSDRKPVAEGFDHRSADALLFFRAPAAGRYVLQVFDFQLAGGLRHVYRLTVTDGPWLDYAFPAGLPKNAETQVTLYGWNLPSQQGDGVTHRVLPQSTVSYELELAGGANRLTLPVSVYPELVEAEPNNEAAQAQSVPFPATVNGRLNPKNDSDVFSFTAQKGDRLAIEVDSAALRFAADSVLSIANEAGKTLLEVDDDKTSRDPSLRFTAPADGRFFVTVRERSRDGGTDFVYRLRLVPLSPDVTARVNTSSLTLHSGQTSNLAVLVDRVDGMAGELEVTALDLPAGVSVKPQPVPAKTPATIQLPFTVAENIAPVGGLVRIAVRGTGQADVIERIAMIAESAKESSGSRSLWVAVSPEIPFTLKTTTTILDAPRMAAYPFPVTVQRKAGFTGPIRLMGVEPDRRGTLKPLEGLIETNSDVGSIPLVLQHQVTEGTTHRSRVMGVAEVLGADGKMYSVFHVAPGNMSIGCQPSLLTMSVEPAVVKWRPGQSQRVAVQLLRQVAMQPVTLRLKLPDAATGIVSEPVEVANDQSKGLLTIHFSQDAALPPRITISVMAESSRDGLPIYGMTTFRLEAQ